MIYGVKVIHTYSVGKDDRCFYEELILKVNADSFDEAYEKTEQYMRDCVCEYKNINGESVKTQAIEALDCFLAVDPEGDVQELYSSFSINDSSLPEEEYYRLITSPCGEKELRPLRNKEFN
ncbi:MAG: DUF4288 domain-containing protein [Oscillibacter sp.]|nr:DUF4288 domain-containing protein [Oscillibacter sp.]